MEFLFKDKPKNYKWKINVEGADIEQTTARLILEFEDQSLLFKGKIDDSGVCTVQVPKLKNTTKLQGTAYFEVIVDSTIFIPWTSEFTIKESKAVKVEMMKSEDDEEQNEDKNIKIKVDVVNKPTDSNETKVDKTETKTEPKNKQTEKTTIKTDNKTIEESVHETIEESVHNIFKKVKEIQTEKNQNIQNIETEDFDEIPDFETFKKRKK